MPSSGAFPFLSEAFAVELHLCAITMKQTHARFIMMPDVGNRVYTSENFQLFLMHAFYKPTRNKNYKQIQGHSFAYLSAFFAFSRSFFFSFFFCAADN